jgi:cytochrome c-type biogenesis protein CcmI
MPEPLVLLVILVAAAALILAPLWRSEPEPQADEARETAAVRHRVALEALRDVETDHRAGTLDETAYRDAMAEAEARAVETAATLETVGEEEGHASVGGRGRTIAAVLAGVVALALVVGSTLPVGGIANATIVDQERAAAQEAESRRLATIDDLLERLSDDPRDADTLSDLADAYLAGSEPDDLARAAAALQVLIAVEPDRADAYERIIAAYLRGGDTENARRALTSYESVPSADPAGVAFLDGLIALRGEDDPERAVAAFDRFLELAPGDPRVEMVRGLRDEAAGP